MAGPHLHRYLGVTVASDRPLDELPTAGPGERPRWGVQHGSVRDRSLPILHDEPADGDAPAFLVVRGDGAGTYDLEFPGRARFDVTADGVITADGSPGLPDAELRHLLLDHVLPRLEGQEGRVVVHASAVVAPAGAVVVLGESGMGKSTLATCLAKAGWPLLTDDAVALDPGAGGAVVVLGAYAGVRLWPEGLALAGLGPEAGTVVSAAGKRRLAPGSHHLPASADGHPLAGVVLLADEDDPGPTKVGATDVFEALHHHRFVVDPAQVPLAAAFDTAATCAQSPAYRLTVTDDHAAVRAVRELFGAPRAT